MLRRVAIRAAGIWVIQTALAVLTTFAAVFVGFALAICTDLTPSAECAARGPRSVVAVVICITLGVAALVLTTARLCRWLDPWFFSGRTAAGALTLVTVALVSWGAAFILLLRVQFEVLAIPLVAAGLHLFVLSSVLALTSTRGQVDTFLPPSPDSLGSSDGDA